MSTGRTPVAERSAGRVRRNAHALADRNSGQSGSPGGTYTNPLVTSAFAPPRGPTMGPADPCVLEHEGVYYVYPTTDGRRYQAMTSTDLVHWTGDHVVFRIPSRSRWKTGELWAPEVEPIRGRFYLYYTAGRGGLKRQHIGVADADSPLGPFVDRSVSAPLIPDVSIDAECFVDGEDQYLYYVKFDGRLSIWVRKLRDPLTLDPESPARLCIAPTEGWEGTVNEGPSVFKRDGRYYMFYSGHYAHTAQYAVGVAVADHPLGPWRKQPAPFNPILRRSDAIGLFGPGHGHNLVGPDGVSDWYLYHHKTEPTALLKGGGLNYHRQLALDRLVSVPAICAGERRFTSHGGSTRSAASPRMPHEWCNFDDAVMPKHFRPQQGAWSVSAGRLSAPADGALLIERRLDQCNRQDFQFEWWVRTPPEFVPVDESSIEFTFDVASPDRAARVGFRLTAQAAQFILREGQSREVAALASTTLEPAGRWAAHSRRISIHKTGSAWELRIDRQPVCQGQHDVMLGDAAWVATAAMPCLLAGYRQTLATLEPQVAPPCAGQQLTPSGRWQMVAATPLNADPLWPARRNHELSLWIRAGLSLGEFELSAEFGRETSAPVRRGAKHGLVHSFADELNYAVVLLDPQRDLLTTTAVVEGRLRAWQVASIVAPTYSLHDWHHLSVNADGSGGFAYSLNGRELIRRAYPALTVGRTGVIGVNGRLHAANFHYSGRPVVISRLPFTDMAQAQVEPAQLTRLVM